MNELLYCQKITFIIIAASIIFREISCECKMPKTVINL